MKEIKDNQIYARRLAKIANGMYLLAGIIGIMWTLAFIGESIAAGVAITVGAGQDAASTYDGAVPSLLLVFVFALLTAIAVDRKARSLTKS